MFRNLTPIAKNLLIANIGLFFVTAYFVPMLKAYAALYYLGTPQFMPFQIFTYMFMHADFWHLFGNMFGLFIFGPLLEQFLGSKRFLILWMVAGIGAGILYSGYNAVQVGIINSKVSSYANNPNPSDFAKYIKDYRPYFDDKHLDFRDVFRENPEDSQLQDTSAKIVTSLGATLVNNIKRSSMIGASGALFGLLVAFAMLFPNTELFLLFLPVPIKAKYFVSVYILYSLYSEFMRAGYDNIAHMAHVFGAVVGFVLIYIWKKDRTNFY
ncbi:Rhomboid family protein [Indibacter alkaliphilus LW1]|jgi:membrane associated rhomboid family serine protease|uniref:Rhomboid family protein n=1 Tax=Indibacter alkaliphilus (strain CCUG 57479 / KCTC 22604 / LW1) TaxID=1189612 RepID=S2CYQ5_INDAL|nr:rhomboid family intramembrane serine protease [Indibacter alkaliphilus]EOZ92292.1 Rhomboid family protein [Indibacter alkaliphilus LW1]